MRKTLVEMSHEEWEALCDRCGQCCLIKLEDEDTGDVAFTRLSCRMLDLGSCRCSDYQNRREYVPDCVKLTPDDVAGLDWLPQTCAYRLVAEGTPLAWWHPLVSGSAETVHEAGVSVRTYAVSEARVPEHAHIYHISKWVKAKR
jgi:uncharacterized cysteine cluster protein YcgN (CxxCxxCC family)